MITDVAIQELEASLRKAANGYEYNRLPNSSKQ
jgi:hypothetical protein